MQDCQEPQELDDGANDLRAFLQEAQADVVGREVDNQHPCGFEECWLFNPSVDGGGWMLFVFM